MANQKYGWKKQPQDSRDWKFYPKAAPGGVPASVDLRSGFPPVYDQGQYGSCTANAGCAAFAYDRIKEGASDFGPSRFFEYYNTRVLDGDVDEDGGGTLRSTVKALAKNGVCRESTWPYTDEDLLNKPSEAAYDEAAPETISNYASVDQDLASVKTTIARGFPVLIGFNVYESFESDEAAATGIIPMPDTSREQLLGGHAILLVGYADRIVVNGRSLSSVFIFRNSWGESWGDDGYGYIPYEYMLDPNEAGDLWVINAVPTVDPSPSPSPDPEPQPTPSPACAQILVDLESCVKTRKNCRRILEDLLDCLGISATVHIHHRH